jgi:hypothetical protein
MALDAAEDDRAAGIIRLCMLTGARVGEVRQARFEDFNLEHLSWTKPATMTKQRRVHRVPISEEAAAIVRQRRLVVVAGSPWLFPGDVPGQPVKEIRRFWTRIQREAQIEDVRIHDLRHTFASLLVSGGASLEMIGKLLGHSQMQTTQRYAHLMDAPLRAGVDAVASAFQPGPGWCTMRIGRKARGRRAPAQASVVWQVRSPPRVLEVQRVQDGFQPPSDRTLVGKRAGLGPCRKPILQLADPFRLGSGQTFLEDPARDLDVHGGPVVVPVLATPSALGHMAEQAVRRLEAQHVLPCDQHIGDGDFDAASRFGNDQPFLAPDRSDASDLATGWTRATAAKQRQQVHGRQGDFASDNLVAAKNRGNPRDDVEVPCIGPASDVGNIAAPPGGRLVHGKPDPLW